jgi:hypothetical protein
MWISTAGAIERPPKAADPGGITFQTLDGDVQQVEISEVWRIRGASGREEPVGAVVMDYAFERLFVKDTLENVVGKVRDQRKIERFTLPGGTPVYIATEKVIGIMRAIPGQHHEKAQSIIMTREGQQQVQESREAVREMLQK